MLDHLLDGQDLPRARDFYRQFCVKLVSVHKMQDKSPGKSQKPNRIARDPEQRQNHLGKIAEILGILSHHPLRFPQVLTRMCSLCLKHIC